MDFQTSVRTCFQKFATFEGRASRSEYWWFVLFNILGNFVLSGADRILFSASENGVLAPLFGLGMILPSLAVAIRRLHDCDKSGWLFLLVLIPLVGWIILLYFYIQPGSETRNRFGENPLNRRPDRHDDDDDNGQTYHKSSIPSISDD